MEFISCNTDNYRAGRTQPVRYIVMHYTANSGDTARSNCNYYHRVSGLQASAHYFCDEYGAMQSVHEDDTAWHCGARAYWHPECRNANSIGIEMCSRKRADGSYYIKPETVANAAALAKDIMQRYGIDSDHVLRHYDVTGKRCPIPWVDDPAQWTAFKDMLTPGNTTTVEEDDDMVRYSKIEDVPDWTPDTTTALWVAVSVDEWPEWVQPTGAHDAYNTGDKVSYNGKHYICTADANVYAPEVYGWELTA